jgi:small-conductance mechanosensitive channel
MRFFAACRLALAAMTCLVFALAWSWTEIPAARGQTPPPQGMSAEQFDALVGAISREVLTQLNARQMAPAAPPETQAAVEPAAGADLTRRAGAAFRAFPALAAHLARLPTLLDNSAAGGRGTVAFLALLVLAIVVIPAVEQGVRVAFGPVRRDLAERLTARAAPGAYVGLGAIDAVALGIAWAAMQGAASWLAGGGEVQALLVYPVLNMVIGWRAYMLIYRLWLRPELPVARLAVIDDHTARTIYRALGAIILIPFIGRVWIRFLMSTGIDLNAVSAMALINGAIVVPCLIAAVVYARHAGARLLAELVPAETWWRQVKLALARLWWVGGIVFYLAAWAAAAYGALSDRFEVGIGLNITQSFLVWWLMAETLIDRIARHGQPKAGAADRPRALDVVLGCVRLGVRLYIALVLARAWAVGVLALMTIAEWQQLGRSLASSGLALLLAYVLWQVAKFHIDCYIASNPVAGGDQEGESEGGEPPTAASRLRTLMPLLRVVFAAVILVFTVLIVLSELGVSTAPLIAGASIVGLAISFGSQSLVKDIVSGIFFLADDAFRVGEYIDAGKAKGTVEGFTLRSLRMRHQNGQVHTIPFGQLGSITNFSRDWTTVKFNLRMARGTDVELLRKTIKRIGQDMIADPEFKDEFLQPLKMQGIADITESALIVRCKFTCRPIKPTYIQRQAIKRMYEQFPAKGIEFAQSTVSVQGLGDPAALAAAGGAHQAAASAAATPTVG